MEIKKMTIKEVGNLKTRIIAITSTANVMKTLDGTFQPFISESETNSNFIVFPTSRSDKDLPVQIHQRPTWTGLVDLSNGNSIVETVDSKRSRYYDQLKREFDERVGVA
jgi:hypothetical protein